MSFLGRMQNSLMPMEDTLAVSYKQLLVVTNLKKNVNFMRSRPTWETRAFEQA